MRIKVNDNAHDFNALLDIYRRFLNVKHFNMMSINCQMQMLTLGSEGIYLDCYLKGKFDNSGNDFCRMGTFKTLNDDLKGMKVMAELGGILNYYLSQFVNQNIKSFMPDEELKQQAMYVAGRQLDSYLMSEKYQELLEKGKNDNLSADENTALQAAVENIETLLPHTGIHDTPETLESEQGVEM